MTTWKAVLAGSKRTGPANPLTPVGSSKPARAASISPVQRSLAYMRAKGYACAMSSWWNSHANIRQDLFGIIDFVAIGRGETIGVQPTSDNGGNFSNHVKKVKASPYYQQLKESGWLLVVHAWGNKGARGKPKMISLREEFV